MNRPRLLDLFCGAGGAAVGYHRAGFEVVGVDIKPQPNYPYQFFQHEVLSLLRLMWAGAAGYAEWPFYTTSDFGAIHASPPCQAFSVATADKTRHVDLVTPLRPLLIQTGLPYVIENVPGAPLENPIVLCGSSFGLKVRRHRLFETNWPLLAPPCNHVQQGQPVGVYGDGTGTGQKRGRKVMSSAEALEVMEMPWSDRAGATQAIPPAYAAAATGETIRVSLAPGEFRQVTTSATFGAKQTVGAEVRINGRVAPFGQGRVVSASRGGVSVVLVSSRKRGPLTVRMANASTRRAVVVVRVEW